MRRHINHVRESNQFQFNEPGSSSHSIRNENQGGPEVTIRLASVTDAMVLAKLRYDFRSSVDQVREDDVSFVQRCRLWMQERLRDDGSWKCWIAERQQSPVGSLWAQLIEKIPNPTSEPEYHVYLTNFYVSKDWRGNGIGSMLLSAALAWSQTEDVHAAILWPTERSRSLYLRHGFSVGGDPMELIIGNGK
jgi:GNAT superfamily N-acetyltransferase